MKKQLMGEIKVKDYELVNVIMVKLEEEYEIEYYENMNNGFVESTEMRIFKTVG